METEEKAVVPQAVVKRPFLLSVILVFSIVSFAFLAILFLISLWYSGSITRIVNIYLPEKIISTSTTVIIFLSGFLLHAAACYGLINIWRMRRTGYYIFSITSLMISGYHLLLPSVSPVNTFMYIFLIIILGLFFKRLK